MCAIQNGRKNTKISAIRRTCVGLLFNFEFFKFIYNFANSNDQNYVDTEMP
jgi:hypothetical protein